MKPRHTAALALVGASSMAVVLVLAEHTRSVKAPQPMRTSSTRASWCPDVPASPAPPLFDGRFGTWADANKRCPNVGKNDRKSQEVCADLCSAAEELWNKQKMGLLNRPDTFPPSTDKLQGPFPLPGGANGYIAPAFSTPAPRSREAVLWNLMVPPFTGKGTPNVNAPLPQWTQFIGQGDFRSRVDCEKARAFDIQTAEEVVRSIPELMNEDKTTIADSRTFVFGAETARCIASDDPRLKGKLER